MDKWLDKRFKEVADAAYNLPNIPVPRKEDLQRAEDIVVHIRQDKHENGEMMCDTDCQLYGRGDYCIVYETKQNEDYDLFPLNCPGPGDYKLIKV